MCRVREGGKIFRKNYFDGQRAGFERRGNLVQNLTRNQMKKHLYPTSASPAVKIFPRAMGAGSWLFRWSLMLGTCCLSASAQLVDGQPKNETQISARHENFPANTNLPSLFLIGDST